jgi:transcription antitermination factor NusG
MVERSRSPLLPSYVFLRAVVETWGPVLAIPDVRGVLCMDGHPAVVADAELTALRKAAKRAPIAVGARVAVELGPFADRSR